MSSYRIPFNRPSIVGKELEYVQKAIEGGHSAGDGPLTQRCSETLSQWVGGSPVLLTTSCTHALEMSALLLGIEEGDEVIVPSFAFVTSAGAFALHGAKPVFVDIRPDTLNLDESQLRDNITEKTKAIVALHYGGVACEMDAIEAISRESGIPIVEDNAHGLLGSYRGKPLGSFGCLATQSFHETKNFICGEGGALVINRPDWVERAEIIREKGTNRSRFLRGQVDKYTWVDVGSSYLPSEILAAFLLAQLEARDEIQARRTKIWQRYNEELEGWALQQGVGLPHVPEYCDQPGHLFYMLLPSESARARLIEHLAARSILSVFHYQSLHLSAMGRNFGGRPGQCPVTERVSDQLLRLPLSSGLSEGEQDEVIDAVLNFQV
ncbi:MAG: dTDP-4-amino-4,6-dideoxygalactose transaminase [Myxococcota bacterium]|jgi:dTDP-4-amino-4,6-dideoxygalactose transaminase|nr:dTDP-4-amino-4,6-dideoxygalactose transaminase [Myxococcota bacterium]